MTTTVREWAVVSCGMLMMLMAGSIYLFGVYSDQLKQELHFSQTGIQTVVTTGNIGMYLAIVSGFMFDRFGPRPTAAVGVSLMFGGYILLYLGAAHRIACPVWAASLYTAVWANGSAYIDTVALLTAVRAFPAHRGLLVGILKSCFGLSASVLTRVYATFFAPDTAPFLLFLGITLPSVSLAASMLLRIPPGDRENGGDDSTVPRRLGVVYGVTAVLALSLAGTSLADHLGWLDQTGQYAASAGAAGLLLVLLAFPVWQQWLPIRPRAHRRLGDGASTGGGASPSAGAGQRLLEDAAGGGGGVSPHDDEGALKRRSSLRPTDLPLTAALLRPTYWVIFATCALGMGAGLAVINNVAQIYHSLHDTPGADGGGKGSGGADVYVSVLSVCNCLGRMAGGAASDLLRHRVSRPLFLVGTCALMGAAMLGFATLGIDGLLPSCVVAGLAYGSFWALLPTLVSELYGLTHFGALYSFQALAPSVGSVVLSEQLTSRLYERFVEPGTSNCFGMRCFSLAFTIMALGCAVAASLALVLWAKVRGHYAAGAATVPAAADVAEGDEVGGKVLL